MYITDDKNFEKKHDYYLNKILSNVECHAGNSGNISLQFLTFISCYFLLLKIVQLTAFYCKITCNFWLGLLQFSLYIVRELTVNLLTVISVVFFKTFTVKITLIFFRTNCILCNNLTI